MKFIGFVGFVVLVVYMFNGSNADSDPYVEVFMQQCAGHSLCEDAVEERYDACSTSAKSPVPDWDAYFGAQLSSGASEQAKRGEAQKIIASGAKYLSEVGTCISKDKGFKFRL